MHDILERHVCHGTSLVGENLRPVLVYAFLVVSLRLFGEARAGSSSTPLTWLSC